MQHLHHAAAIKQTLLDADRGVVEPLVPLLLPGSSSHSDNAMYLYLYHPTGGSATHLKPVTQKKQELLS